MPTGHAVPKHESGSGPPAEKRTDSGNTAPGNTAPGDKASGRWRLTAALSLLAATVAVAFSITPLREALPWTKIGQPTTQRLHADLETALGQVYRSFELEDEAATYDRIAQSVTGAATRDIYLEVRRSLLDEDGGRVSIDDVWLDKLDGIRSHSDGGCQFDATWVVRGSVGHFGHDHERQNRYRARIRMLPQAGTWKISSVQITEQERER